MVKDKVKRGSGTCSRVDTGVYHRRSREFIHITTKTRCTALLANSSNPTSFIVELKSANFELYYLPFDSIGHISFLCRLV